MAIIYRHWFPCTVTPENPHGKGYTGQTHRSLKERDRRRFAPSAVKDSVSLKRAIAKYGKENMQTDIIENNISPIKEVVNEREIYWIAYFNDFHNGYNQTIGGDGAGAGKQNPCFGRTGEKHPCFGRTGEKHPMFGKKRPEHSERMSKRMSGEKHPRFGKGHLIAGEKNPMFGNGHLIAGEKNPFFGKGHLIAGEKNPNARPEYSQARCFFFLEIAPMNASIKEKRKQFREAFNHIPRGTLRCWFRKWQSELENS